MFLETRIVYSRFKKRRTSFIYSFTENCVSDIKKTTWWFFTCRIISPVEHKGHTITNVSEDSHKTQQPWLQFLKAPHLLALAMNSLSRGPSICQNAAVCVTSVKWLMQNLKQNSSKSWTHTTKIKTRKGLFLINFDWITCLQIPHPKDLALPQKRQLSRNTSN